MAVESVTILKVLEGGFSIAKGTIDVARLCSELSGAKKDIEDAKQKVKLYHDHWQDVVSLVKGRDVKSNLEAYKYVNNVVNSAAEAEKRVVDILQRTKRFRWFVKDRDRFDKACRWLDTAQIELSNASQRLNGMELLPQPPPYIELTYPELESFCQSYRPSISQDSAAPMQVFLDNGYRPYAWEIEER